MFLLTLKLATSKMRAESSNSCVFGCKPLLADAAGEAGCLLMLFAAESHCCHGGQYVSVNNLAWRGSPALTLKTLLNDSAETEQD